MNVEHIAIEDLKPYSRNNKIHSPEQIQRIANSIREFGFLQPVLIDKDSVIVAGHARVEAQKLLGEKTIPIVRINGKLTAKQVRALRVLDNQLAAQGVFNLENLEFELTEIGLDLKAWGIFPEWDTVKMANEALWDELGLAPFSHPDAYGSKLTIQFASPDERKAFCMSHGMQNATEVTKSAIFRDGKLNNCHN